MKRFKYSFNLENISHRFFVDFAVVSRGAGEAKTMFLLESDTNFHMFSYLNIGSLLKPQKHRFWFRFGCQVGTKTGMLASGWDGFKVPQTPSRSPGSQLPPTPSNSLLQSWLQSPSNSLPLWFGLVQIFLLICFFLFCVFLLSRGVWGAAAPPGSHFCFFDILIFPIGISHNHCSVAHIS